MTEPTDAAWAESLAPRAQPGCVVTIGVDPGPTPGIARLIVIDGVLRGRAAAQCSPEALLEVLEGLGATRARTRLAVEKFVPRGRLDHDQRVTAEQVQLLSGSFPSCAIRPASAVKPWATDDRLAAAELLEPTKGMRHSRDAARHALFAAVRDGGLADPLSGRPR